MIDYYKVLGLDYTASESEIKYAYRKLSKKFHPDMNGGDKFFEERFKEIQEAYDKLNDFNYRNAFKKSRETATNPIHESEKVPIDPMESSGKIILIFIVFIAIFLVLMSKKTYKKNNWDYNSISESPTLTPDSITVDTTAADTTTMTVESIDSTFASSEILPTKIETENWILEKLKNYTSSTLNKRRDYRRNYAYEFDNYYLIIKYQEGFSDTITRLIKVPIYDIKKLELSNSMLTIINYGKTIINYDSELDSKGDHTVSDYFYCDFKKDAETNMAERLNSAFLHLKKFYNKPISTEAF
jgi:curved DNA-binding protein CbpA